MNPQEDTVQRRTLRRKVWFRQIGQSCMATTQPVAADRPRPLRLAKLMALAIRYEQLLRAGHVKDRAELAQLGEVTQARITQIMHLLLLAPDIQEAILMLPDTDAPVDPVSERDMRPIVAESNWARQRALWDKLLAVRFPQD